MSTTKIVTPGFIDVYGYEWDKLQCNLYNKISAEIEQKEIAGSWDVEALKDNRHRIYHLSLYSATARASGN